MSKNRKKNNEKDTDRSDAAIKVALIVLVGTLITAVFSSPVLLAWIQKSPTATAVPMVAATNSAPIQTSSSVVLSSPNPNDTAQSLTPSNSDTDYLKDLFIMWTISGKLDQWVLSAFNSILVIDGDGKPIETMKTWVEEAKVKASNAVGLPVSSFDYLEVDLSINLDSLTIEDSFYRLWKLAVEEGEASNMAKVRLALIERVGETRQQELIGEWNEQIR